MDEVVDLQVGEVEARHTKVAVAAAAAQECTMGTYVLQTVADHTLLLTMGQMKLLEAASLDP